MALSKEFTTNHGFIASNAYARILSFKGNKDSISVYVEVFKDQQARVDNLNPIAIFDLSLSLPNGATMQQMYDALKLLPEFQGAVDV